MSYTPNTWTDGQKLPAAGVNRIEQGLQATAITADAAIPRTAKKSAYRFGGTHATSNMGGTQTTIRERTPGLILPVKATRWRLHFRNWNSLTSSAAGANPVTVSRVFAAPQAGPAAASPYVCSQPLQQMPGTAGAVQGKTEWLSDWHTPESIGITDTRRPFNVQLDLSWTAGDYIGNTSSMWCAMLDTIATDSSGTILDPTIANPGAIHGDQQQLYWYTYNYMVGEAWLEYEYADSEPSEIPNILMLGHSYVDGAQFVGQSGFYGTPDGFAQKFARRHRAAVAVNAYSTSKVTDWVSGSNVSDKFDILTVADGYKFDAIFFMLGDNDIVNEAATPDGSTMLTRIQNFVNAVATKYPGVPIFAATGTPFGAVGDTAFGSGGKAVTQAMLTSNDALNAGLWTTIRGLAGVIDFERVFRDPSNARRVLPAFLGSDNIHPTSRGYDALADAITIF